MILKSISQSHSFPTTAADIYTILTDERRHSSFTGDLVHITDSEDEPFTLSDGLVSGKNVVLERGKKIIWSFQYHKPGWPEGHFSEAAIILSDTAKNKCRLELFHTAIPETFTGELEQFWKQNWEALTYYLER